MAAAKKAAAKKPEAKKAGKEGSTQEEVMPF